MNDPVSPSAFDLPFDELEELLAGGEMDIEGRMPYSSNATFLVTMSDDDPEADDKGAEGGRQHKAIYKPGRGERPLWDFPPGPLPPRGGRLPAVSGPRLVSGASDRDRQWPHG